MTVLKRSIFSLFAIATFGAVAPAQAHFKLLKPASWIVEGAQGDPQKSAPCGPEGSDGMFTSEITTVKAGETIMVEFEETIHHPGWFRISLAEDRSEFQDITFSGAGCSYDMSKVPEMPHDNVLVDGLAKDEDISGANRKFMEMVTIPDKPCEKCTLQVIQVMADTFHSPPGCIYYHCADLKIVAAGGGEGASSGSAATSGSAGAAGAATSGSAGASAGGSAAATAGTSSTATATAGQGGSTAAAKPTTTTPGGTAGAGTRPTGATASAATGTAGKPATSSGSAGSTSSTKTDTTTETEAPKSDEGGCAVSQPGSHSSLASAALLSIMGMLFGVRRRHRNRA